MWFSKVVLPDPKKPVKMCAGTCGDYTTPFHLEAIQSRAFRVNLMDRSSATARLKSSSPFLALFWAAAKASSAIPSSCIPQSISYMTAKAQATSHSDFAVGIEGYIYLYPDPLRAFCCFMLERFAHRTAFRWGSEYMSFKTHFSEFKATPGTAPISCTRLVNLSLFSPLGPAPGLQPTP